MTFWMIIRNSLRQHALSTAITAASIGLGCGLLVGVSRKGFVGRIGGAPRPADKDGIRIR